MRNLATSVVVLALASVAMAGPTKAKPIHCAVETKNVVDVKKATASKMYTDYKGRRYFFCCGGCPEEFKANPAKYAAKADSIPTPKVVKPAIKKKKSA